MPSSPLSAPAVRRTASLLAFLLAAAFRHADAQAADHDGWSVRADWLQASAVSFDRSTMPSAAVGLEWRAGARAMEFGYLRVARELSTVQGAYATLARPMLWGPATVLAGVGIFAGQAVASADSTGYTYIVGGVTGHQPRYSYSTGASFGAGVQLALEVPLGSTFGVRASAAEWAFGGDPVKGDNARFLAGLGLTLKLPRTLTGSKAAKGTR